MTAATAFAKISLPVLLKTVENKNSNEKWYNSCSKARTQRTLCLKTKLIF